MTTKKQLDDRDFPVKSEDKKIKTRTNEDLAVTDSKDVADEMAERLNDDAWRRHEDNWSA